MSTTDPKITISNALTVIRDEGVPPETLKIIERELLKLAKQEKEEKAPAERTKTQLVVLLDDSEGKLSGQSFLGWVVKIDAESPPQVALDRVVAAGRTFNETKKGKRVPVKSVREVFSGVARKHFKDENPAHRTVPQTKEPVLIMAVKGDLT